MTDVLLLDVGNQRLKWAVVPRNELMTSLRSMESRESGVINLYHDNGDLSELTALQDIQFEPGEIISSIVANQSVERQITLQCRRQWQKEVLFVGAADSKIDLENGYDRPAQLGADRWFAACAAWWQRDLLFTSKDSPGLAIIVDAGTAITVDVVQDGRFQGGAILPGYATILKTMAISTGKINIDLSSSFRRALEPVSCGQYMVPSNSDDAVSAGALASVRGGVEQMIRLITSTNNQLPTVVITGGDAELLSNQDNIGGRIDRHLVLKGLALESGVRYQ